MKIFDRGTEDFDRQTVVSMWLPHAVHPMHGDWRSKADALIDGLREEGWLIVRAGASTEGSRDG